MNKPNLLTIALLLIGFISFGQSTLKVVVRDSSTNETVYNAVIKIFGDNKSDVMAYGFTDDSGEVIFSLSQKPTRLEISHLSYKPIEKIIEMGDTAFVLLLSPQDMMLNQVSVTFKREIVQKGDTTVYRTDAFRNGNEGNLEDLIRKMPNFSVDADGSISYKNKKIEKILVEGDELTGQNYEAATRTLNPDMIKEIEAVENYIENSILKKIKKGNQTVLNLKVKNIKNASGSLELGGGLGGYNNRLTILGMVNNWKSLSNVALNNVGARRINLSNAQNPLGSENAWTTAVSLQKRVELASFFPNNLGIEQENINREKMASTNHTLNIGKKVKLVSNLLGVSDTKYSLNTSDIDVFENTAFRFYQKDSSQNFIQKLRNESKLTYKINDNNLLTVRSYWQMGFNNLDNFVGLGFNNALSKINQSINYKERSAYVQTEYSHYLNKNNVLSMELRYANNKLNDEMSITNDNDEDFFQTLSQKRSYSAAQLNWFNASKNFDIKNSIFHTYQTFNSALGIQDLLKNTENIAFNVISSGITTNTAWRLGKINLGVDINSSIQSFEGYNSSKWLNTALGSMSYVFSPKSILAFSANYNETPQLDNTLHSSPIVLTYRSNQQGKDSIRVNKELTYMLVFTYNDVLKQKLGATITTMYSQKLDWYAFNQFFFQNYIQTSSLNYSPNNTLLNVGFKIDKLVYPLRGTIKLNSSFTKIATEYLRNGLISRPDVRLFSAEVNYISAFKSKLYTIIGGKFNITQSDNFEPDKAPIPAFWINIYSAKLGLKLDKFVTEVENQYFHTARSSSQIINLSAQYKLSDTFVFSFEGRNVLNSTRYNFINITPIQRIDNAVNLIGRQLLLKVGVNF